MSAVTCTKPSMQYDAFLQEAKAAGLIRPGAQGLQDIQNLNRKFADATGLTADGP